VKQNACLKLPNHDSSHGWDAHISLCSGEICLSPFLILVGRVTVMCCYASRTAKHPLSSMGTC